MERRFSGPKIFTGITLVFAVLAMMLALILSNSNGTLKRNLNAEKLNAEKLLAEKLSLDKEIHRYNQEIDLFKKDIENLKGRSNGLDNLLAVSQKTLTEKQAEINRLAKSSAGKKAIEKELAELRRMKDAYDKEITSLNQQNAKPISDNSSAAEENNALKQKIETLETENNKLSADNHRLKSMVADNYLIAGFKGRKDKLTLVARRTNKLTLSFDVPEDITPNLKFNILNPDDQVIEGTDNRISTRTLESEPLSVPSRTSENSVKMKTIQMEYNPEQRFMRGVYKIEIFNNDKYLGSCQVRLK